MLRKRLIQQNWPYHPCSPETAHLLQTISPSTEQHILEGPKFHPNCTLSCRRASRLSIQPVLFPHCVIFRAKYRLNESVRQALYGWQKHDRIPEVQNNNNKNVRKWEWVADLICFFCLRSRTLCLFPRFPRVWCLVLETVVVDVGCCMTDLWAFFLALH